MGWLSMVGMGWREEGVFAARGNHVQRAKLAEYTSICGSYTNQLAAIEPYIWPEASHHFSVGF